MMFNDLHGWREVAWLGAHMLFLVGAYAYMKWPRKSNGDFYDIFRNK